MHILILFCILTLLNGLPFRHARMFTMLDRSPADYCSFCYQIAKSNLLAELRKMAFEEFRSQKCLKLIINSSVNELKNVGKTSMKWEVTSISKLIDM